MSVRRRPEAPEAEGYGRRYRRQLTSEVKVRKRTATGRVAVHWELKKGAGSENESLDCRVLAYAAAMVQVFPHSLAEGLAALPPLAGGASNVVRIR